MSKVCQVTGRKPTSGNNVSHSVRRTKRRFLPNLMTKKLLNPLTGKVIKVKVSAKGLKNLTKSPKKWFKKLVK